MKDRPGGYTRIVKLGARRGDASEVVILELVDYKVSENDSSEKKAKKTAKKNKAAAKEEKK